LHNLFIDFEDSYEAVIKEVLQNILI